jgi:hypothetical protein
MARVLESRAMYRGARAHWPPAVHRTAPPGTPQDAGLLPTSLRGARRGHERLQELRPALLVRQAGQPVPQGMLRHQRPRDPGPDGGRGLAAQRLPALLQGVR